MGHSLNRTGFRINQNLVIDDKTFNPGYILVSDSKGNASWKNPSQFIDQTEPLDHFIGELYGGGIVVAVWREEREATYEKVLIASVRDYGEQPFPGSATNFEWSWVNPFGGYDTIGPSASYHSYGASNSLAIVTESLAQGYYSPPAASKCLGYLNEDLYGLGVYGDWYLPSTFELNCLANNAGIVNRVIAQYAADKSIRLYDQGASGSILSASMSLFCGNKSGPRPTGKKYWTSTELGMETAYSLQMDDLKMASAYKEESLNVRPFRLDTKRWNGLTWVQDRNKTGQILIVDNGTGYLSNIEPVITSVEQGLGNTTYTITSYSLLPDDLSIYDHIWDVDVLTNQLTVLNNTKYTNYLKQGGALFILGENKSFTTRDNDLATFITGLGGGTVTFDADFPRFTPTMCDVDSEFLLANNISTVGFNWVGRFSNIGTGSPITRLKNAIPVGQGSNSTPLVTTNGTLYDINTTEYPVGTTGNAVVWKTGSLSQTPKGAIVVVLDINFIITPGYNGSDFMANISQILNKS
jgi:hypothetical protein